MQVEKDLNLVLSKKSPANIKKLTNYTIFDYRLKLGNYRASFSFDSNKNKAVFTRMRHRKDLY